MKKGHIYCITSPSGKNYVGQCVKRLSNGREWGYLKRWESHKRDAHNPKKDYCRLLNKAIRKYGAENFTIKLLKECYIFELDFYENIYIEVKDGMTPLGYNLIEGNSRQSQETKQRRSKSMMGKNKGKVYSKRDRIRDEDSELPKYVRHYLDKTGKEGYRVSHHPLLKDKGFFGKYESMESKLSKALNYLNQVEGSTSSKQSGE